MQRALGNSILLCLVTAGAVFISGSHAWGQESQPAEQSLTLEKSRVEKLETLRALLEEESIVPEKKVQQALDQVNGLIADEMRKQGTEDLVHTPDFWKEQDFFDVDNMPEWGRRNLSEMGRMSESIKQMMDEQLKAFRNTPPGQFSLTSGFTPTTDITEDDDKYTVHLDLPGVEKSNIKVDINGTNLTVSGERTAVVEQSDDSGRIIRQERRVGSFSRSIPLPGPVVEDQVEARQENGVLVITLPKAAPKPSGKAIQVK
jgi:HSP20 family protein